LTFKTLLDGLEIWMHNKGFKQIVDFRGKMGQAKLKTRALCGYHISNHRGMPPALALLYNTFGNPSDKATHPDLVTDGNPAYDSAVMAYNDLIKNDDSKLTKPTVTGLKNLDDQSKEY
jgi:hypothetical protein